MKIPAAKSRFFRPARQTLDDAVLECRKVSVGLATPPDEKGGFATGGFMRAVPGRLGTGWATAAPQHAQQGE